MNNGVPIAALDIQYQKVLEAYPAPYGIEYSKNRRHNENNCLKSSMI